MSLAVIDELLSDAGVPPEASFPTHQEDRGRSLDHWLEQHGVALKVATPNTVPLLRVVPSNTAMGMAGASALLITLTAVEWGRSFYHAGKAVNVFSAVAQHWDQISMAYNVLGFHNSVALGQAVGGFWWEHGHAIAAPLADIAGQLAEHGLEDAAELVSHLADGIDLAAAPVDLGASLAAGLLIKFGFDQLNKDRKARLSRLQSDFQHATQVDALLASGPPPQYVLEHVDIIRMRMRVPPERSAS